MESGMRKFKALGLILTLSTLLSSAAFANCQAVVQNHSSQDWIVRFTSARGNVYFPGAACDKNGPCVVPAHGSLNLEYTYTTGYTVGVVNIKDQRGETRDFGYYGNDPMGCPIIKHNLVAKSVSLNDPGRGSFVVLNDVW
jgi:hypothetical protein